MGRVSGTLRSQLLLAFLAFGLLPLTVGATVTYVKSRAALLSQRQAALDSQAEAAGEKIDRNLLERYGDVQAFAFHPDAAGTADDVEQVANFYTQTYGIYDLMIVADRDGRIMAANSVRPDGTPLDTSGIIGRSVKGEEWFETAVGGGLGPAETFYEPVSSDALTSEVLGATTETLDFAAPIRDADGAIIRVWSNRASWDRIVGQIMEEQTTELHEQGHTSVRAQISGADGASLFGEASDHGADLVTGASTTDGALGFAGYDLTVRFVQDAAEAARDARSLAAVLAVLWIMSAAGITAAALLTARRIARRLGRSSALVDGSAHDLTLTSEHMETTALRTVERATRSTTASHDVNATVAMMATAMEEMHSSIAAIARSSQDATMVASNAAGTAVETNAIISRLDASSEEISAVIDVITSIARQTNLLALNATIEATRAGDAGKGFAVVANEVKELAKRTAAATEEVGERIAAIQRDTGGAVDAIGRITTVILQINDSLQTIASAVEEQTATTTDIAERMTGASRALADVTATVRELADLARRTETTVREVRSRAGALSTVAADLSGFVGASGPPQRRATDPRPAHAGAAQVGSGVAAPSNGSIFDLRDPAPSDGV